MIAQDFAQNWKRIALASVMLGVLAGCDEAIGLVDAAANKGESDVPEAARDELDPATLEQLRRRAQGQNFN